jgi:hypothetical protein
VAAAGRLRPSSRPRPQLELGGRIWLPGHLEGDGLVLGDQRAGLGYELASVFAGGPAPLIATWLLHKTGTPYSISAYIVFAAVVTVACVLALSDRSRADIEDLAVYGPITDLPAYGTPAA